MPEDGRNVRGVPSSTLPKLGSGTVATTVPPVVTVVVGGLPEVTEVVLGVAPETAVGAAGSVVATTAAGGTMVGCVIVCVSPGWPGTGWLPESTLRGLG